MKVDAKTEFRFLILEHLKKIGAYGVPGAPEFRSEHVFHPKRFWRFDYAIPDWMLAFEYEGRGKGHL